MLPRRHTLGREDAPSGRKPAGGDPPGAHVCRLPRSGNDGLAGIAMACTLSTAGGVALELSARKGFAQQRRYGRSSQRARCRRRHWCLSAGRGVHEVPDHAHRLPGAGRAARLACYPAHCRPPANVAASALPPAAPSPPAVPSPPSDPSSLSSPPLSSLPVPPLAACRSCRRRARWPRRRSPNRRSGALTRTRTRTLSLTRTRTRTRTRTLALSLSLTLILTLTLRRRLGLPIAERGAMRRV